MPKVIVGSFDSGICDLASERLRRAQLFGDNLIPMKKSRSFVRLMVTALKEPTLIILEVAAVISMALSLWNIFGARGIGIFKRSKKASENISTLSFADESGGGSYEWIEGVAIAVGVLIIVLVTATNDYGKEHQFRALQTKVREEQKISVIRNGEVGMIPVHQLLVGDICLIKYGEYDRHFSIRCTALNQSMPSVQGGTAL